MNRGLREDEIDPSITVAFGKAIEQLERVSQPQEGGLRRNGRKQAVVVSAPAAESLAVWSESKAWDAHHGIVHIDRGHCFLPRGFTDTETAGSELRGALNANQDQMLCLDLRKEHRPAGAQGVIKNRVRPNFFADGRVENNPARSLILRRSQNSRAYLR